VHLVAADAVVVMCGPRCKGSGEVRGYVPRRFARYRQLQVPGRPGHTIDVNPVLMVMRQVAYEVDATLEGVVGAGSE